MHLLLNVFLNILLLDYRNIIILHIDFVFYNFVTYQFNSRIYYLFIWDFLVLYVDCQCQILSFFFFGRFSCSPGRPSWRWPQTSFLVLVLRGSVLGYRFMCVWMYVQLCTCGDEVDISAFLYFFPPGVYPSGKTLWHQAPGALLCLPPQC